MRQCNRSDMNCLRASRRERLCSSAGHTQTPGGGSCSIFSSLCSRPASLASCILAIETSATKRRGFQPRWRIGGKGRNKFEDQQLQTRQSTETLDDEGDHGHQEACESGALTRAQQTHDRISRAATPTARVQLANEAARGTGLTSGA